MRGIHEYTTVKRGKGDVRVQIDVQRTPSHKTGVAEKATQTLKSVHRPVSSATYSLRPKRESHSQKPGYDVAKGVDKTPSVTGYCSAPKLLGCKKIKTPSLWAMQKVKNGSYRQPTKPLFCGCHGTRRNLFPKTPYALHRRTFTAQAFI